MDANGIEKRQQAKDTAADRGRKKEENGGSGGGGGIEPQAIGVQLPDATPKDRPSRADPITAETEEEHRARVGRQRAAVARYLQSLPELFSPIPDSGLQPPASANPPPPTTLEATAAVRVGEDKAQESQQPSPASPPPLAVARRRALPPRKTVSPPAVPTGAAGAKPVIAVAGVPPAAAVAVAAPSNGTPQRPQPQQRPVEPELDRAAMAQLIAAAITAGGDDVAAPPTPVGAQNAHPTPTGARANAKVKSPSTSPRVVAGTEKSLITKSIVRKTAPRRVNAKK